MTTPDPGGPMSRPRVCYLRGSYLNPYESQYLEPLQREFELVAAHAGYQRFDVERVGLPRVELRCLDYLNGHIPRNIGGFRVPNPLKYLGYEEVLFGLGDVLPTFDVVHAPEQSFYFTWQAARLKQRGGFRLIVTQAEVMPYWYLDRRPVRARAREVREAADLFLARTERARAALMCEGVEAERIRVVGHGVDARRFMPGERNERLASDLGLSPGRPVILFVGRLVWTKGIFALANAAALLERSPRIRRLDPVFLLVGDGPERRTLEHYLDVLDLRDRFVLAGRRPYSELPDIHRLANLFVLPSIADRTIQEQFGIVLIEAMATETPVIACAAGAIDEVVGSAGMLVQPNDPLRLAEAIERLLLDEERRSALAELGRKRVESLYRRETIARRLAASYREVLGLPGGHREMERAPGEAAVSSDPLPSRR